VGACCERSEGSVGVSRRPRAFAEVKPGEAEVDMVHSDESVGRC
jgi:hypothetical protein